MFSLGRVPNGMKAAKMLFRYHIFVYTQWTHNLNCNSRITIICYHGHQMNVLCAFYLGYVSTRIYWNYYQQNIHTTALKIHKMN